MRSVALAVSLAVAVSIAACGDNLPGNAPPDVAPRTAATPEDTPVTINVTAEDPEGAALTFSYSTPAHGTITGDGASVTYRPDDDYHGPDELIVTVDDGENEASATISITVMPVNDAPVAGDDALAADEDTAATVNVTTLMANDTDVDGDTLSITALAVPSSGTAALDAGVVTYTPADNFTGTATVEYTLSDGNGGTDTGLVTITVGGENDPPVAVDDNATTAEDTAIDIASTALTANDTDADGQALSVTMVSGASNGTVDLAGGTITFTPTANFNGTAGFDYVVSDGADMDTGHVTVMVTAVNDTPVATAGTATTAEDMAVTITIAGTDVDGDALTFAVAAAPTGGTLGAITQVTPTTATVVYTPNANFNGGDSFTFTADDGPVTSAPAAVMITVTPANDGPTAMPGGVTTAEDTALDIVLTGTDVDGNALTFAPGTATSGTLSAVTQLSPTTARVTYTPNANFNGADSFTFTVNDGTVDSAAATVMITVTPANDGPVATPQAVSTPEDTAIVITLAGTDADGDPLTFAIGASPTGGALGTVTQATPTTATVTYTPNSNSTADDAFTFTVDDGGGPSPAATVTIDVTPVNDPPVATDDNDSLERDTPKTQPFAFYLANDTDGGDGGPLTITVVDGATNGSVAITAGNNVTFTPDAGYVGPAGFDYTVSDGTDTAVAHVDLTVINTNIPVVAVDDDETTAEDTALVRLATAFTGNDIDPDPQTLTITAVHDESNGTVAFDGTTITFTPDANYNGPAFFRYTVSDGFSTDIGQVDIDVTAVNDLPDAVDDLAGVDEDGSVDVSPLANDTNDDGALTISAFTQGANGTVTQTLDTLTYAPAANFSGTDTFTYTAQDPGGLTDTATVTVTVNPVNDGPTFADQERTIPETAPVTLTLTGTDVDVPVQTLTFTVSNPPDFGTLGAITQATPTTATVVYTPNASYVGDDFMHFTVSDGALGDLGIVVLHLTNVVVCGDGQVEAPEACDDTNLVDGDGCSMACAEEQGWDCVGTTPSVCATVCGDNFVVSGHEECDDMNAIETDGCTTQCESGAVCDATVPALAAGDRFTTDPATGHCYVSFDDDQITFAAAQTACIAAGGHLASITSSEEQAIVASVHNLTQEPWIGLTDELVEGSFGWITGEPLTFDNFVPPPDGGDPEDCVNLTAGTSTWNDTSCTFLGFTDGRICELDANSCGDGIVHTARGEACDDGNTNDSDGCSATCQIETGAVCGAAQPTTCAKVVINELDYDNVGTDNAEFIELYNAGTAAADLTNHSLVLANGAASPGVQYGRIDLGGTLAPGAYALICPANSVAGNCGPHVMPVGTTRFLFAGSADQVQQGPTDAAGLFVISGVVATPVDLVSYEGTLATAQITNITGTSPFSEGTGVVAGENNVAPNLGIQRLPNGRDTQNNDADFGLRVPTPGAPSVP